MQTEDTDTALKLRVLLVDDEPSVHALLRKIILTPPPMSIDLFSAFGPREGLSVCEDIQPCAILLDLRYPEQTIEDTLDMIPAYTEYAPVLILTGSNHSAYWTQGIEKGAVNFLQKDVYLNPNNRGFLLHSITNALYLHDAREKQASKLRG